MAGKPDSPENRDALHTSKAARPSGAIFVTTFLTVVILVLWFGTFVLNVLRS